MYRRVHGVAAAFIAFNYSVNSVNGTQNKKSSVVTTLLTSLCNSKQNTCGGGALSTSPLSQLCYCCWWVGESIYLNLPPLESCFSGNFPRGPLAAPMTSPSPSPAGGTGWVLLSWREHLWVLASPLLSPALEAWGRLEEKHRGHWCYWKTHHRLY